MKDNLHVGKLFTEPLHQDVKHCPCQSFRAVKVACKQDFPLTWLRYISLVMVECIFLVAAYWACLGRQWSVSFLSLLISDAFFCCCFPALERDLSWQTWNPCPYRRWADLCSQVQWLWWQGGQSDMEGLKMLRPSLLVLGEGCSQLLFWVARVMRSKYIIQRQLHMFKAAPWKIKWVDRESEREFSPVVSEIVGADIRGWVCKSFSFLISF